MNAAIVHVGKDLLQEQALLLPSVRDFFRTQILLASDFEHEREVTNAVTPQWVLSNLTTATSPSVCMQDKEVCHNLASLTLLAVVSEQVYS